MVGTELKMAEKGSAADEVLAHSEDEGEWEEEPAPIESRPSGTQVISARLPSALAEALLAEAQRLRVRPSELVREVVEKWLTAEVPITVVYEIDCKRCGMAVYPDIRFLSRDEARQAQTDHMDEHDRGEL